VSQTVSYRLRGEEGGLLGHDGTDTNLVDVSDDSATWMGERVAGYACENNTGNELVKDKVKFDTRAEVGHRVSAKMKVVEHE
jgi:hypothetical protein